MTIYFEIGPFRDRFEAIKNGKEEWSLDFLEQLYADKDRYQLLDAAEAYGASLGCVEDGYRSLMHKAVDDLDADAIEFLYDHGGTLGYTEGTYEITDTAGWYLVRRIGRLFPAPSIEDGTEKLSEWRIAIDRAQACFSILCARCEDLTWVEDGNGETPLSFLLDRKSDSEFVTGVARRTRFASLGEQSTLSIVAGMAYLPPDPFFELFEALQDSHWCPTKENLASRVIHFGTPYEYELLERLAAEINPEARDKVGCTLLDWADYYGDDKVIPLLERLGICRSGIDPATAKEYAKLDHQLKYWARSQFANFRSKPIPFIRGHLDELIGQICDIDPYEPEAMRWVVYEKLHDGESVEDVSDFVDTSCTEMRNSRFYPLYAYNIKGLSAGVSPESYLRMYLCILLKERKLYEDAVRQLESVKQSELDAAFLENNALRNEWSAAIDSYFFAKGCDRKFLDILDHWKALFPERYAACVAFERMRGWAYWNLKDLVAAELCFRTAIESGRAIVGTHYALVSVLMEQDLYEEAAMACDGPLKNSTETSHVFLRAKVAYFNNDEDEAALLNDQVLRDNPDHKGALALRRKLCS